jgi:hypothetical protein
MTQLAHAESIPDLTKLIKHSLSCTLYPIPRYPPVILILPNHLSTTWIGKLVDISHSVPGDVMGKHPTIRVDHHYFIAHN